MSISVNDFFPEIKGNLTKIKWAHATNSKELLEKAFNSSEIMMIEADVIMGFEIFSNKTPSPIQVPIMAHPPNQSSDLSLSQFLNSVNEYNRQPNKTKKGVKLDFKTIDAYEGSRPIIQNTINLGYPIIINADILKGPVNATDIPQPVDSGRFLRTVDQTFSPNNYVLSLGWTTRYVPVGNATNTGNYTTQQIDEMLKLVNGTTNLPITYPVRACYAANSIEALKTLLEKTPAKNNATLTIWSGDKDVVDTSKLSQLIRTIGVNKVYVDVSQAILDKLDFNSAFTAKSSAFVVFASMIIALFTAKLL